MRYGEGEREKMKEQTVLRASERKRDREIDR